MSVSGGRLSVFLLRFCRRFVPADKNPDFDMFVAIPDPENSADSYVAEWFYFGKNRFPKSMVLDCYAFIPAKMQYADKLVFGNAQMRRRVVVKVKAAAR